MKSPANRRHARGGLSRPYPKLGRYEVRPPATTKPTTKNKSATNQRPGTKLKLGRYEVHVPATAAPRPAETLGPGELRPERTSQQSTPMLDPYEVHRPQRTEHHQPLPTLGLSEVHQRGTLHRQKMPMLGPYEIHPAPTIPHTQLMLRSFPLQLARTMPQTMPMLGAYIPVPPQRSSAPYPSVTDNRRKKTPHERRKPASRSSNHNRRRRKTKRRGKQGNSTSQQLNTRQQKALEDLGRSTSQVTTDPAAMPSNAVSIFPESMPVPDTNNIRKIEQTTPPEIAPAPAPPAPTPKRQPTPDDCLMSDVLDIDILGPWTEEDERLYRADIIPL